MLSFEEQFETKTGLLAIAPWQMSDMLAARGWFNRSGVHVLVDGQFGSTGKGVLAGWLAENAKVLDSVSSNAGPNSGHTSYYDGKKFVCTQLPTATVIRNAMGKPIRSYLNAGAVINPEILNHEATTYLPYDNMVYVHPNAACIGDRDLDEPPTCSAIASTNKGVGPAMARKLLRDPSAVVRGQMHRLLPQIGITPASPHHSDVLLVETSQGFSLGLNRGFFPYCTSRECTVQQALADAAIPLHVRRKVVVAFRTFPIRVGNTDKGNSGGWYPDQKEIGWDDIGVEAELTTVTKRVRRVATFSMTQFEEALDANSADAFYMNFMNYLPENERPAFVQRCVDAFKAVRGQKPDYVLLGYGPTRAEVGMLA